VLSIWVTGGGTREPIDDVRWIGNLSTGRLALELARRAARRGHRVTAFLAEGVPAPRSKRIRVERFVSTADLERSLCADARAAPDAILHAAAVSDYAPRPVRGKVGSGKSHWTVELWPLPKVVARLRRRYSRARLALFKLESGVGVAELRRRALAAARRAGAQAVFANRLEDVGAEHRGFLLDVASGRTDEATTRAGAASLLVRWCERGADGATRSGA
jgi:phosphopantothenoylcysteine decarboxylase/phosphopantothenate--cysteine ligase